MRKTLGVLVFLLGSVSAIPTHAGDAATLKCNANRDLVWVYDSLTTFDVQTKIHCGENVEIIGRTKGYVKIRMHDGSEGYVGDSAIPGLPPLEDTDAKPGDANAPAATNSLGELARRIVPHPVPATASPVVATNPVSNTVSVSQPALSSNGSPVNTPISSASVVPPPSAVALSTPAATVTLAAAPVSPVATPSANRINTAATVSAVRPAPSSESATLSAAASTTPPVARPVAPASASAAIPKAKPVSSAVSRPVVPAKPNPAQPAAPNLSPAPAVVKPLPPVNTEMTANIPAPFQSRATPGILKVSASADSEDYSDNEPVIDSADPACQFYFSAYGLAPAQIKWLAENRKKEFPSICPAPDPSKVDFVVLFTHDVNAYNSALPTPVHTDRNGFSDFSATVGVDTAALSNSEADKAHRQFVWVFLMKRGAFDPAKFSPRRKSQYAQVESNSTGSKAGVKTVQDAFEFVEQQQPSR